MKKIVAFTILAVGLMLSPLCAAEDVQSLRPSGFVNDYAGILSAGTKQQLDAALTAVERKTTAEISVVTIKTTFPLTIEQYAVDLFGRWGIGKKGTDNGVLLLVAIGDRKVRIEVGYGLEGAITDLKSKMIIQDYIVPPFKKGNYELGISAAVVSLIDIISAEYNVKIDLSSEMARLPARAKKGSAAGNLISLLFFIMIFGFRFGTLFWVMGSGRRSYWSGGSGGSFGGGFGGFGGGFSGGGGASGGW